MITKIDDDYIETMINEHVNYSMTFSIYKRFDISVIDSIDSCIDNFVYQNMVRLINKSIETEVRK